MKPLSEATEEVSQNMTTLSECVTNAIESGYAENFRVSSRELISADGKSFYKANSVKISNFYRFEGLTNPSDNAILYLVETSDGRKGILIDAYGVYADSEFADFIRQVVDISKKKEN